jgi:hypothetical protein
MESRDSTEARSNDQHARSMRTGIVTDVFDGQP